MNAKGSDMIRSPMPRPKPQPRREATQWTADRLPGPRAPAPALRIHDGKARLTIPLPKENAIQHRAYMALVRQLRCALCGYFRKGFIQFCHADFGKGTGIKTDCRRGWPGCGPHDGLPGCHWIVGTSGQLAKVERREFERRAGDETRAVIEGSGRWPARLPRWPL